jgi:hypothetical protein
MIMKRSLKRRTRSRRRSSKRRRKRRRRRPGSSGIESGGEGAGFGSDSALLVLLPGGVDRGHGSRGRTDGGAQCGYVVELHG